jgi:hypothetical protein
LPAHDDLVSTPSDERPPLRIGHQEREATYQALDAHLDAGRLDAEEYGDRYAKASVARTRPELEALFVDLPEPHPFPRPSQYAYQQPFQYSSGYSSGPVSASGARNGWQPSPARIAAALLAIVPLIALVLFLLSGVWIFFLLIPAIGSIAARLSGRGRGYRGHRGWAGACGPR